jgi:hypothetical protein
MSAPQHGGGFSTITVGVGTRVGASVGNAVAGAEGEHPEAITIKTQPAMRIFLMPVSPLRIGCPTLIAYLFTISTPLEK